MKLHRIEVRDIASLYGDNAVDLDEDLGAADVFLVIGPTGSGKSTLLDAVCLALYGETPRQRGRGEDPRRIMSWGTGSCRAAVEFSKIEERGRVRYRATWSCHRARQKPDGELQPAQRRLERLEGGEWVSLVDSPLKKNTDPVFDAALDGLTVEEFYRAVLLAQGEFARFLQDDKKRGEILERLTDTGLYKRIGAQAADRRSQQASRVKELEVQLGEVHTLSPEERAEHERVRLEGTGRLAVLDGSIGRLEAGLGWLRTESTVVEELERAREAEARTADALTEAAEDLDALAEHERCARGWPLLDEADRAKARVDQRRTALPELERDAEARAESLGVADGALGEATGALDGAREVLESQRPAIRRAREAHLALRAAERLADEAQEVAKRAETDRDAAAAALKRAHQDEAQARQGLARAQESLEGFAGGERLASRLSGLEAGLRALTTAGGRVALEQAGVERVQEHLTGERRRLAPLEADWRVRRTEVELARAARDEARRLLDGACKGRPAEERRQELETAREAEAERAGALGRVQAIDRELEGVREALDVEDARLRGLSEERVQREEALEAIVQRIGELQRTAGLRQGEVERSRWVLDMAHERDRLEPGEPCPLCGGTDHDAEGLAALSQRDEAARVAAAAAQSALEAAQAEIALAEERRVALREAAGAAEGHREAASREARRLGELRGRLQSDRIAALTPLGLSPTLDDESLRHLRDTALERQDLLGSQLQALRVAEQAWRRAVEGEQETGQAAAALELKLSDARGRIATQEVRLRAAEEAVAVREREREEARRSMAEACDDADLVVPEGTDFAAAVESARERVLAWKEASAAREAAAGVLREAEGQRAQAESRGGEADRRVEAASADLVRRVADRDAAREATVGLLPDDEDPDALERRLEAAFRRAEGVRDQAAADAARIGREATASVERLAAAREALALEEEAEATAGRVLDEAVAALGLADRDALRSRRLVEAVLGERVDLRRRLGEAREAAAAVSRDHQQRLAAHRDQRPDDLAPDADREAMEAELGVLRGEREGVAEAFHRAAVLLQRDDTDRKRGVELREAHDQARRELAIWERVHALIGKGSGKAFQEFAQILNLRELIGKANAHLRDLSDRYRLEIATSKEGDAALGFTVRDAWQADTERTLSTLSGGETFLVSLALALGLAGFRQSRMPIETLLLDEGFGTLDRDTLDVAMSAIERLQTHGTQVGIISHVEALQERVAARVRVEPEGGGRSRVRTELG